jgi:hypothetical protein
MRVEYAGAIYHARQQGRPLEAAAGGEKGAKDHDKTNKTMGWVDPFFSTFKVDCLTK